MLARTISCFYTFVFAAFYYNCPIYDYCDNDKSELRENFFGSVIVNGDNKNRGWIDANIFGTIKLKN